MTGGISDGYSIYEVAKHHKLEDFEYDDFIRQWHEGIKIESEHTNDEKVASEISKDHLFEDKDYYKKLRKSEKIKQQNWWDRWLKIG
jgi:hypothetical protein